MGTTAIIFDFDGTLADSLPAWITLINRYAHEYGFREILPQDYAKYRNESSLHIAEDLGVPLLKLPVIALKLKKAFAAEIPKLSLHAGMGEVIKQLSTHCQLGIVSSNSKENIEIFLQKNGVSKYFAFVDSENTIFGKGKALKKVLKHHGIDPGTCWYVGDETRDVDAAREAGVYSAAVTWGIHSRQVLEKMLPTAVIDKPEELSISIFNKTREGHLL